MRIAFTPGAWRDWKKLSKNTQVHLKEKLILYSHEPFKYATKLTDEKMGQYRFRIGDYRIIFDIINREIIIIAIGNRKDIYK